MREILKNHERWVSGDVEREDGRGADDVRVEGDSEGNSSVCDIRDDTGGGVVFSGTETASVLSRRDTGIDCPLGVGLF